MRRLLYCGEWIESHALHVFLLHAPDFLGYDGAIEMAADHPDGRRARAADEEGRQRPDGRWSAAARSTRSTCGSAASTGCRPRAELRARCGRRLERARDEAVATVRLVAGFDVPRLRAALRVPLAARRARVPDRVRQRRDHLGRRLRRARLHRAHRGGARRALQRPARPPRRVAGALRRRARWRATRSTPTGCRRSPARPPPRPGSGRRAATRSARSSCAPSSSSRPAPRRCASSTAGRRRGRAERGRAAPGRGGLRGQRGPAGGAVPPLRARRRAASSGTPRSSRRPRRTSRASRPTCAPCVEAWSDLDDHALQHRVRAGHPQLRPVHLVRDPLPRPHRGADMTEPRTRPASSAAPGRPWSSGWAAPTGATTRWAGTSPAPSRTLADSAASWCHRARGPDRPHRAVVGLRPRWWSSTPCAPARRRAR